MVYDVSTDKVDDFGGVPPVHLPVAVRPAGPLLGEGYVADGSVHPDVDDEILRARELDPPFKVSSDAPVFKLLLDPFESVVSGVRGASQTLEIIDEKVAEGR